MYLLNTNICIYVINKRPQSVVQKICNLNPSDVKISSVSVAELERQGKIIGPYDMQLAAQALTRGLTFVTNNSDEFTRIKKLKVENWLQDLLKAIPT